LAKTKKNSKEEKSNPNHFEKRREDKDASKEKKDN